MLASFRGVTRVNGTGVIVVAADPLVSAASSSNAGIGGAQVVVVAIPGCV